MTDTPDEALQLPGYCCIAQSEFYVRLLAANTNGDAELLRVQRQVLPSLANVVEALQSYARYAQALGPLIADADGQCVAEDVIDVLSLLPRKALDNLVKGERSTIAHIRDMYPMVTPEQLHRPVPTLLLQRSLLPQAIYRAHLSNSDPKPHLILHHFIQQTDTLARGYGVQWICDVALDDSGALPSPWRIVNGGKYVIHGDQREMVGLEPIDCDGINTVVQNLYPSVRVPGNVQRLCDITPQQLERYLNTIACRLVELEGPTRFGPAASWYKR